jgi:hypothetical protein
VKRFAAVLAVAGVSVLAACGSGAQHASSTSTTTPVTCMVGQTDEAAKFRAMTVPQQRAYIAACRSAEGQFVPGQPHTPSSAPAPGSNQG